MQAHCARTSVRTAAHLVPEGHIDVMGIAMDFERLRTRYP
jgi:hypothetical protein